MIVSRRPLRSRLTANQLLQRGHTTAFCQTGIPNCLRKTKPETATSIRKLSPRPRMLPMGRPNLDGCRDSLPAADHVESSCGCRLLWCPVCVDREKAMLKADLVCHEKSEAETEQARS